MVQYSHVRGGLKPKKRVVISKALAKLSPRSIFERCKYPVEPSRFPITLGGNACVKMLDICTWIISDRHRR